MGGAQHAAAAQPQGQRGHEGQRDQGAQEQELQRVVVGAQPFGVGVAERQEKDAAHHAGDACSGGMVPGGG
ncbi:hypothetical protein G6F35_016698 [Rhizopus arrhizus]|nr:hypothetical protein G6F35_016698 [Rhizopus arrhizus]